MFKPNCNIKYTKTKGNSLASTKSFLEAYKAIDFTGKKVEKTAKGCVGAFQ